MPPPDRDLVQTFKAARWDDAEAFEAFLREASPATGAELRALLPLLIDRSLAADPNAHRRRCAAFAALVEKTPTRSSSPRSCAHSATPTAWPAPPSCNPPEGEPRRRSRRASASASRSPSPRSARPPRRCSATWAGARPSCACPRWCATTASPGASTRWRPSWPETLAGAVPLLADVIAHGSLQERARAIAHLGDREVMAKDIAAAAQVVTAALDDRDEHIAGRAIDALASLLPEDDFFDRVGLRVDATSPVLGKAVVEALRRYATPRSSSSWGSASTRAQTPHWHGGARQPGAHRQRRRAPRRGRGPRVEPRHGARARGARARPTSRARARSTPARTVLWLLRSRDVNVRRIAVEVARQTTDRANTLWPKLMGMLRDEDWWVRERVMDALAEIAGEQLTRYLVGMLDDPSDVVRRFAIGALAKLKDPKSLGALVRCAMSDADWWARGPSPCRPPPSSATRAPRPTCSTS